MKETHSETKSWKSSRILSVNPKFFIFLFFFSSFFSFFFHHFSFIFSFFHFFHFFHFFNFSFSFHFLSFSFVFFHFLSFSFMFFHVLVFLFFFIFFHCFFLLFFLLVLLFFSGAQNPLFLPRLPHDFPFKALVLKIIFWAVLGGTPLGPLFLFSCLFFILFHSFSLSFHVFPFFPL